MQCFALKSGLVQVIAAAWPEGVVNYTGSVDVLVTRTHTTTNMHTTPPPMSPSPDRISYTSTPASRAAVLSCARVCCLLFHMWIWLERLAPQ